MTSGEKSVAMTRLRKRKVGQRDSLLWDLIVDNDDICFTHVLPRLHSNDLKFLHGVNTETRALIKRSPRAGDLKKRFDVSEMSSISTLEFAWENRSLWPSLLKDEPYFVPPTRPQRFILPRPFQSRYRRHLAHFKPLFQLPLAS